jgi:cell shape-determining protein MreC
VNITNQFKEKAMKRIIVAIAAVMLLAFGVGTVSASPIPNEGMDWQVVVQSLKEKNHITKVQAAKIKAQARTIKRLRATNTRLTNDLATTRGANANLRAVNDQLQADNLAIASQGIVGQVAFLAWSDFPTVLSALCKRFTCSFYQSDGYWSYSFDNIG